MTTVKIQRPSSLEEFIGQKQIKQNLQVYVDSLKIQGPRGLKHIMLNGGPGKGKTSLAMLFGQIIKGRLRIVNGTTLQKVTDITNLFVSVGEGDVIFIDEIHRLNKNIEEMIYSAMEDYTLYINVGKGPQTKTINLALKPFTVIGATTKYGLLSQPLRDRFGITFFFEDYSLEELVLILKNFAKKNQMEIDEEGMYEIALRSKKTPRICLNLCKRILDFMYAYNKVSIDKNLVLNACDQMGIDPMGLERLDRKYLELFKKGVPLGLKTISATLGEGEDMVEEIIENYLMKIQFIERTPKGRVITDLGIKHRNLF